jgi:ankyrin repeat protein
MKTKTLLSILIFVLAVLIITSSCATTPKTKEEREGVQPEVFFQSVKSGDYAEVKKLIKAGADVNAQDKYGYTALKWASRSGHTDIVKLLREAGAKE